MAAYQKSFYCTKPLTSLAVGSIEELWALLNNKANDPDYETPYGLLINFNYNGQKYFKYDKAFIKQIGQEGLANGLKSVI
jgi:hypothetical protein